MHRIVIWEKAEDLPFLPCKYLSGCWAVVGVVVRWQCYPDRFCLTQKKSDTLKRENEKKGWKTSPISCDARPTTWHLHPYHPIALGCCSAQLVFLLPTFSCVALFCTRSSLSLFVPWVVITILRLPPPRDVSLFYSCYNYLFTSSWSSFLLPLLPSPPPPPPPYPTSHCYHTRLPLFLLLNAFCNSFSPMPPELRAWLQRLTSWIGDDITRKKTTCLFVVGGKLYMFTLGVSESGWSVWSMSSYLFIYLFYFFIACCFQLSERQKMLFVYLFIYFYHSFCNTCLFSLSLCKKYEKCDTKSLFVRFSSDM